MLISIKKNMFQISIKEYLKSTLINIFNTFDHYKAIFQIKNKNIQNQTQNYNFNYVPEIVFKMNKF